MHPFQEEDAAAEIEGEKECCSLDLSVQLSNSEVSPVGNNIMLEGSISASDVQLCAGNEKEQKVLATSNAAIPGFILTLLCNWSRSFQ
jgi:hypothetical protein